jgi:hypothetical protein
VTGACSTRRRELVALVRGSGLEVTAARYADSLGYLATLAYKAVGSGKGELDRRSLVAFDRLLFPSAAASIARSAGSSGRTCTSSRGNDG